jgi:hypothetical protein
MHCLCVQSLTQERIWDAAECGNQEVLQQFLSGTKTGDFMFGKKICEVCLSFFNLPISFISPVSSCFCYNTAIWRHIQRSCHSCFQRPYIRRYNASDSRSRCELQNSHGTHDISFTSCGYVLCIAVLVVTLPWTPLTFCARVVFVDRMVTQRSCGLPSKDLPPRYRPWLKLGQM